MVLGTLFGFGVLKQMKEGKLEQMRQGACVWATAKTALDN